MSQIKVRINGRGNAWPVFLGQEHSFYDINNYEDLANASFSIIKLSDSKKKENEIGWELMIDAGHGATQYLIKNHNRIPDALFLTHPHIDHIIGLDWIVQSYNKLRKEPYPVYMSRPCWEKVKTVFPHLKELVNFKELVPYQSLKIKEVFGVELIPFPVYHGKSAEGATMLFFIINDEKVKRKILFTGDVLCPLLRNEDYFLLSNIDLLVTDSNNRFPYPKSNHWSILKGKKNKASDFYSNFLEKNTIGLLLYPHLQNQISDNYCRCFDYFLNREFYISDFPCTVASFIDIINPKKTAFIHYSGSEDEKYHKEKILNTSELEEWIKAEFKKMKLKTDVIVPYVSQHIDFL